MAILLSGDFDPDQMIATIDKYFGDMQPNENIPQLAFEPEAPITKPIVKEVYGPDAANVTLAWRTDNAASDDAEYLLLASRILYNGQAGMIDLDLMQQQKVLDAFSYPDQRADYGALVLQGLPKAGQTLDEVRDLLLAEVAKLRNGEFSEELIKAVVNNLKVSTMREEETNVGRVEMYLSSFYNDIPWSDEVTKLDRIGSITKEQLVAWANEKLGTENYGIIYKRQGEDPSVQKIAKPALTPIQMNRDTQSAFLTEIQNSTVTPIEPVFVDFNRDMEIFKTDSSLEVLYKKMTSTTFLADLPLRYRRAERSGAQQCLRLYRLPRHPGQDSCGDRIRTLRHRLLLRPVGQSEPLCDNLQGIERKHGTGHGYLRRPGSQCTGRRRDSRQLQGRPAEKRADNKLNQEANFAALQRFAFFGGEAIQRTTLNNEQLEALTSDVLIGKVRDLLKSSTPSSITVLRTKPGCSPT